MMFKYFVDDLSAFIDGDKVSLESLPEKYVFPKGSYVMGLDMEKPNQPPVVKYIEGKMYEGYTVCGTIRDLGGATLEQTWFVYCSVSHAKKN